MVKLAHFDVDFIVVNLLHSYLRNRSCVAINGQTSSFYKATSGAPQGSILGPLLLLIHVNELQPHTSPLIQVKEKCVESPGDYFEGD